MKNKLLAFPLFCILIILVHPSYASASFSDVKSNHWAYNTIQWAEDNHIVTGYTNGTFRPNQAVSEPEFLSMLLRSYPEIKVSGSSSPWYKSYYDAAARLNLPLSHSTNGEKYTRGEVAKLLAGIQGHSLSTNEAIILLTEQGIAKGKQGTDVSGFMPGDPLSRAEAPTFIYRLKQVMPSFAPSNKTETPATTPNNTDIALRGVSIGDSEASVIAALGQPARKDVSTYSFTWYIYNQNYKQYAQIGIQNGTVVALYSNADAWNANSQLKIGASKTEVKAVFGDKANSSSDAKSAVYNASSNRTTVYYDIYNEGRVDALLIMKEKLASADSSKDTDFQTKLITAYERQIFDLTNVARVRNGLGTLEWNELAADAARKHSVDMGKNSYFDHTGLDGRSPGDRLAASGLTSYRSYGENIAAGQSDAFAAHASWMNSEGHRRNILNSTFTTLGVGIAMDSSYSYNRYYTQNFYTPR